MKSCRSNTVTERDLLEYELRNDSGRGLMPDENGHYFPIVEFIEKKLAPEIQGFNYCIDSGDDVYFSGMTLHIGEKTYDGASRNVVADCLVLTKTICDFLLFGEIPTYRLKYGGKAKPFINGEGRRVVSDETLSASVDLTKECDADAASIQGEKSASPVVVRCGLNVRCGTCICGQVVAAGH